MIGRRVYGGWFVMGQHTSVAWFIDKAEALKLCRQLNVRGGCHYRIEEGK